MYLDNGFDDDDERSDIGVSEYSFIKIEHNTG